MTDVDAIRCLASERDLEFVDLDTYGVDPSAGEILPADVARTHHMVAVKRKFGTPVIATCDPDDVSAHDSVRASIGRDFISVVASRDQISDWLDRLFDSDLDTEDFVGGTDELEAGLEPGEDGTGVGTSGGLLEAAIEELTVSGPEEGLEPASTEEVLADPSYEADLSYEADQSYEREGQAVETVSDEAEFIVEPAESPAPEAEPEPELVPEPTHESAEATEPVLEPEPAEIEASEPAPAPTRGASKRRSKKSSRKDNAARVPEGDAGAAGDVGSEQAAAVDDGSAVAEADAAGDAASDSEPIATATGLSDDSAFAELPADAGDIGWATSAEPPTADATLEPATSLLPSFASGGGTSDEAETTVTDFGTDKGTDGQTAFAPEADAVESWSPGPGGDAADLVAEAVASFQEQHWDEQFGEDTSESFSSNPPYPPLAKALLDGERVSPEDMQEVLEEHDRTGQSIARILTAKKLVTEADLMWGMAQEMGLDFVDLDTVGIDFTAAGSIPEATARHHNVMVIGSENGTPIVAASNPTDVFAMDDLRTIMGRNFIVVVATRSQISTFIGRVFNSGSDAADMAVEASLGFDGSPSEEGVDDIQAITEDAPIVRYVNLLILQALNERASDIHVEPTGAELRIRYRIDGVLHDVSTAPRAISAAVITRLKVMADLNVAEHRIPQDGRISLNVGSKGIDLRIATLPTIHGEKVVMRVLDKSSVVLGFGDLGFDDDLQLTYEGIYTKPYGTILVTGPTGSGKSTTLYTTLTALNSPEKNIITVEDPVELQLKGVNQVQLNVRAGLTFASALKSILRSDPDIVLVGEIRDKETALIAIEAALTGHLVLATLHTNNAASTPMRLIEMGLEPFLVTSSLSGVLAQRLARRLCMHCKEAYEPSDADIAAAGWTPEEIQVAGGIDKVYRSVGCSACSNTGYRGRKALAELMPMSEEIEKMIIEGGSVDDIHRLAVSQGMQTLRHSGLRKAIEGETTLEEVLRVVA